MSLDLAGEPVRTMGLRLDQRRRRHGVSPHPDHPEDAYYEVYAGPTTIWQDWRLAGIDYDLTQLRLRFADGIDPSWAEYILSELAVELLEEVDVSWARPAEP